MVANKNSPKMISTALRTVRNLVRRRTLVTMSMPTAYPVVNSSFEIQPLIIVYCVCWKNAKKLRQNTMLSTEYFGLLILAPLAGIAAWYAATRFRRGRIRAGAFALISAALFVVALAGLRSEQLDRP